VKIAVLIDGAFLNKIIKKDPDPERQASRIVDLANRCLEPGEILYRTFYYDCGAFAETRIDFNGAEIDFSSTPQHAYQQNLLAHLARQPYVAVRLGMLSFGGWRLSATALFRLRKSKLSAGGLRPEDFQPDFKQKGVDMRIGLDTTLLAMDRLVERIALVTCDADFIPAMNSRAAKAYRSYSLP
jgi:uncharacterized LabA/DUF88 family protein